MASNSQDDVISVEDLGESYNFSGFSTVDSDDQVTSKKPKSKMTTKSVTSKKGKDTPQEKVDKTCKNKSKTKTKSASSATPSCSNVNTSNFDLTKLSQSDIDNLVATGMTPLIQLADIFENCFLAKSL